MRRTVSGANISFWYRIDSEAGGDFFTFYRDGNADIQASGTTGWTFCSVSVPPGSHNAAVGIRQRRRFDRRQRRRVD
ncbi:MAG: hypothetical protein IIC51_00290 [Planctomycetes bacterium]|nr:hypothetical protein [Planctomycetota bacterium]